LCPTFIGINTGAQEALVIEQLAFTSGYGVNDALAAQLPIVTGAALGGLGSWAAKLAGGSNGLGVIGQRILATTVGVPQVILDGALIGKAAAAADCKV
jgi:hypothetical protein